MTLERIKEIRKKLFSRTIGLLDNGKLTSREILVEELIELEIDLRRNEIGQDWNESRGEC